MSNVKILGNVSGTGSLTIAAPNTNTDITINLPSTLGNAGSSSFVTTDASGNLGIGTSSPVNRLDVAGDINISVGNAYASNIYYNGGWKYKTNGYAGFIKVPDASGNFIFSQFANNSSGAGAAGTELERMRIDSSGNVGIGTSSVFDGNTRLELSKGGNCQQFITCTDGVRLYFSASGNTVGAMGTFSNHPLVFRTNDTERARIDSSGNLLVGTTSDLGGQISSLGNGRDGVVAQVTNNSNSPYLGRNASGSIIYIVSGAGTIYAVNTTVQSVSDVRTKENIRDSEDGLQTVLNLKPRRFDFKEGFGGDRKNVLGFIAQEIEEVFPDAVDTMPAGAVKNDDPQNPYKSVGPGALIPVLVKAIQEQQAIITQLQADVAALKGAA